MTPPPAPPPASEGPTVDSVMSKEKEAVASAVSAAAGEPPQMAKVVGVAQVQQLVDAMDAAMDAVTGGAGGHIPYAPPNRSQSVKTPLPKEVWDPLFAMGKSIEMLANAPGGEVLKGYVFDPVAAADGTKMADTAAVLNRLSMDKKAAEFIREQAVKAAAAQVPGEETMEPMDDVTEEEAAEPPAPQS